MISGFDSSGVTCISESISRSGSSVTSSSSDGGCSVSVVESDPSPFTSPSEPGFDSVV